MKITTSKIPTYWSKNSMKYIAHRHMPPSASALITEYLAWFMAFDYFNWSDWIKWVIIGCLIGDVLGYLLKLFTGEEIKF